MVKIDQFLPNVKSIIYVAFSLGIAPGTVR
jgi:hypothetical protein